MFPAQAQNMGLRDPSIAVTGVLTDFTCHKRQHVAKITRLELISDILYYNFSLPQEKAATENKLYNQSL